MCIRDRTSGSRSSISLKIPSPLKILVRFPGARKRGVRVRSAGTMDPDPGEHEFPPMRPFGEPAPAPEPAEDEPAAPVPATSDAAGAAADAQAETSRS